MALRGRGADVTTRITITLDFEGADADAEAVALTRRALHVGVLQAELAELAAGDVRLVKYDVRSGSTPPSNTKAYREGFADGLAWDLDAYETIADVERDRSGWDEATIDAMGLTACVEAWGVPRDTSGEPEPDAWSAACRDYNEGAHAGALSSEHHGLRPSKETL